MNCNLNYMKLHDKIVGHDMCVMVIIKETKDIIGNE